MEASSVTRRLLEYAVVRDWAWWQLPAVLRSYVGAVPVVALVMIAYATSQTTWTGPDLMKFLLLLVCGMVSVAATPRVAYLKAGVTRDFLTAWVLPVAILLPPVYAMLTPIPLQVLTQWRVHKGVVYRRVFTAGAISLTYGAASLLFRQFPDSFAGSSIGSGTHALTWVLAVAVCELVGGFGHKFLIMGAIKLSDPSVRLAELALNREALQADFAEFDLSVLITVVVAVNPVLAISAVPTVLLARRFIMHAQLLAALPDRHQDRAAQRLHLGAGGRGRDHPGGPDAHPAGRRAGGHRSLQGGQRHLRSPGRATRRSARSPTACAASCAATTWPGGSAARSSRCCCRRRASRMRSTWPSACARTSPGCPSPSTTRTSRAGCVRLTISVGVASLDGESRELTDLLAAADAALYHAKETGRNKTHVISASSQTA